VLEKNLLIDPPRAACKQSRLVSQTITLSSKKVKKAKKTKKLKRLKAPNGKKG